MSSNGMRLLVLTNSPAVTALYNTYCAWFIQVSDGIVAPGYEPEALAILEKKKGGKYCVLQMDPNYQPPAIETRTLYGLQLMQRRNDCVINSDMFTNIVSNHKTVSIV